jgi:hypothetical protein
LLLAIAVSRALVNSEAYRFILSTSLTIFKYSEAIDPVPPKPPNSASSGLFNLYSILVNS